MQIGGESLRWRSSFGSEYDQGTRIPEQNYHACRMAQIFGKACGSDADLKMRVLVRQFSGLRTEFRDSQI